MSINSLYNKSGMRIRHFISTSVARLPDQQVAQRLTSSQRCHNNYIRFSKDLRRCLAQVAEYFDRCYSPTFDCRCFIADRGDIFSTPSTVFELILMNVQAPWTSTHSHARVPFSSERCIKAQLACVLV